jgi:hypothetical protein
VVAITIVFVIVIAPIAIGVPAALVFIPPTVVRAPAALALCDQLPMRMFGLLAAITVMLDSLVKLVIRLGNVFLTITLIGAKTRCGEEEQPSKRCARKNDSSEEACIRLTCGLHWLSCL